MTLGFYRLNTNTVDPEAQQKKLNIYTVDHEAQQEG